MPGHVLRDRIGHPVADGPPLPDPPADLGGGDLDRGYLDAPGDQGRWGHRHPCPGEDHDLGESRKLLRLVPGLELRGGVGADEDREPHARLTRILSAGTEAPVIVLMSS